MQSENLKLYNLRRIEDAIFVYHLAKINGENFHPDYKKHPDLFRELLRSDMAVETEMGRYLSTFSDQILGSLNWFKYESRKKERLSTKKFAAVKLDEFINVDWDKEGIKIQVLLTDALVKAVVAGGQFTLRDTGMDDDWSDTSVPVQRFLRQYTFDLVKGLNKTSQNKLREALQTSLDLGEDRSTAADRIVKVISDPVRAAAIARTESVRSFASGKLEVGKRIGADRKQWSATMDSKTSNRCRGLHGQVVPIDGNFKSSYDSWEGDRCPSHVNCRCLVRVLLPAQPEFKEPKVYMDFDSDTPSTINRYLDKYSYKPRAKDYEPLLSYQGSFHRVINGNLRNGNEIPEDIKPFYDVVETVAGKHRLKDDVFLYRGMFSGTDIKAGMVIKDKGFMSTSLKQEVAQDFLITNEIEHGKKDGYILRIAAPKGTNGVFLGKYINNDPLREHEFLVDKGKKISIISVTEKNGYKLVDAVLQ